MYCKLLSDRAKLPTKATKDSAGYDLYSAEDGAIAPNGYKTFKIDISFVLPDDCYGRIAPKSGLAANYGIQIGAGVIDKGFTGNVGVVMFNHGDEIYNVVKGQKIAQLICEKIKTCDITVWRGSLPSTERGDHGFGSSGLF